MTGNAPITSKPKEPNYCEDCRHHVKIGYDNHVCKVCRPPNLGGVTREDGRSLRFDGEYFIICERARRIFGEYDCDHMRVTHCPCMQGMPSTYRKRNKTCKVGCGDTW